MSGSIILVGGGLANCLLALRLLAAKPGVRLTVLEAGPQLGGNHTWSFHSSDLTPAVQEWLLPLASYSWPHYDVRFPQRERRLVGAYHSLTSEHLHRIALQALGGRVVLGTPALAVTPESVTLRDGRTLTGDLVIDGRGVEAGEPASQREDARRQRAPGLALRYQKFLGQVVTLTTPHGLTGPLLMDACVSQTNGYRFVYLLPFTADQVLIEDTYYSDTPVLDLPALRRHIAEYGAGRNWVVREIVREETGVLPIVLDAEFDRFWPVPAAGLPRSGLRAGLFHHTTGYSLPEAAALADELPRQSDLRSAPIAAWIRARVQRRWREQRLFRLLNRMLFLAAAPAERYRVLQHFYRLPQPVIEHFYAGLLTASDARQILSGSPPVPVHRALRYVLPSSSHERPDTVSTGSGDGA